MSYQVYIGRKALKTLEKIRPSDYRKIKILSKACPIPPNHLATKNLSDELVIVFAKETTGLFMIYLKLNAT